VIKLRKIETFVFRVPVEKAIRSAVGAYNNRPAVFVRVEDETGVCGWGEAFCNFPPCGAEHRARLIETVLKPLLFDNQPFESPGEVFAFLTEKTAIITLKSGEFGPFAQCIAALDIAIWDLWARKRKIPLWKLFNAEGNPEIKVYASGLGPDEPAVMAQKKKVEGYNAFKLKVGFDQETDEKNLDELRCALGDDVLLMVDANQVWNLEEALSRLNAYDKYNLLWVEEPLRCDRPIEEWRKLAEMTPVHLAGGECLSGDKEFERFLEGKVLEFVQPDIIKWGGFSGLLPLIESFSTAEVQYCPHTLAGGIGLLASAHLLAASRCPGWLEIDANNNPLRMEIIEPFPLVSEGKIQLSDSPGLGWEVNVEKVLKYRIQVESFC
jgi:D-galactarolactone cycloisomerase